MKIFCLILNRAYSKGFSSWSFYTSVRSYHFYWKYWKLYLSQKLDYDYKPDNAFDRFPIKKPIKESSKEKTVGHLPQEISRPTKFLLDRGVVMHAEISSLKYKNSPLVQSRLELPCIVFALMPPAVLNEHLISRYKSSVALHVELPKRSKSWQLWKWKINRFFSWLNYKSKRSNREQEKLQETSAEENNAAKKKLAQNKDIRAFFTTSSVEQSNKQPSKTETSKKLVINVTRDLEVLDYFSYIRGWFLLVFMLLYISTWHKDNNNNVPKDY